MVNFLTSWIVVPFLIPPFRIYTPGELLEALFWQVLWIVGWPIGILGVGANLLFNGNLTDLGSIASMLIYPGILLLFIRAFLRKRARSWEFILLQVFITLSFTAVWRQVLNGYDFMAG